MADQSNRRQVAWRIMQAALKAVDPARAVKNYLKTEAEFVERLKSTSGRIFVIGAGKAGAPMAQAVAEILGDKIAAGRVVVKYGHSLSAVKQVSNIQIVEAGHPVPDQAGLEAGRAIADLLADTGGADTVLCLISGGGSALLILPADDITLSDLKATTQSLLRAGASIDQINTIRKHLSAVKGGRLAELAAPARVHTLILSDVVGDPLSVIASGPTVPDPSTFAEAWSLVERYHLQNSLPAAVVRRLKDGLSGRISDTPTSDNPIFERVTNVVIGSNRMAAQAAVEAARAAGMQAQLLTTFIEGEAREVGKVLAGLAKGLVKDEASLKRPACLILGGETTVTLIGEGQGGRNQEMALAAAIALEGWIDSLVVCLGTDGTDGPTDAAGAYADGSTIARATEMGLDAFDYLSRNDAYNFFASIDDLIITGPTQTNVNDLALVMAW